jgi:hypothetical protein
MAIAALMDNDICFHDINFISEGWVALVSGKHGTVHPIQLFQSAGRRFPQTIL